jgi:hypothetical protein
MHGLKEILHKSGNHSMPFVMALVLFVSACVTKKSAFRSTYEEQNALIHHVDTMKVKPFLKVHYKNGDVLILTDNWEYDTLSQTIKGNGTLYDFRRQVVSAGTHEVNQDSVVLFESNLKLKDPEALRRQGLISISIINSAASIFCLASPKTCYGSCPTFYINNKSYIHHADAEGFSNAILPSLQYADIDDLKYKSKPNPGFKVLMKNEALETQCVKSVQLLSFPVDDHQSVYHAVDDVFFTASDVFPVIQASGEEGDISGLLTAQDLQERFSLASSEDLKSREEIILEFDTKEIQGNWGLVLDFRQTLLTTYLIYSAMSYMGNEIGDYLSQFEMRANLKKMLREGLKAELGDIEVYVLDPAQNRCNYQGGFNETGPIALNQQMLPLKESLHGRIKVKLVLNKGHWRIDYASIVKLEGIAEPVVLDPYRAEYQGKKDDYALEMLLDPQKHLVTLPGDSYAWYFNLPEGVPQHQLFLKSEGYYLEWMRNEWISDKNPEKLRIMLLNPSKYLRLEAPLYKEYERYMEDSFWNSRIDYNNIVQDED